MSGNALRLPAALARQVANRVGRLPRRSVRHRLRQRWHRSAGARGTQRLRQPAHGLRARRRYAGAADRVRRAGLETVAIYHSHPRGPATPSSVDIAPTYPGVVHIICRAADRDRPQLRGFLISGDGFCRSPSPRSLRDSKPVIGRISVWGQSRGEGAGLTARSWAQPTGSDAGTRDKGQVRAMLWAT